MNTFLTNKLSCISAIDALTIKVKKQNHQFGGFVKNNVFLLTFYQIDQHS